jgi:hypothetical protein
MTRATGQPYRHVLELLEELTRPGPGGRASALSSGAVQDDLPDALPVG